MTLDDTIATNEDPFGIGRTYARIEAERQKGPDYEDCLEGRDDSAPENAEVALAMIAAMFAEGTVTERDAEPVLYGILNAINRQRSKVHRDHQAACKNLRDLADQEDFSEVATVRLEQAQVRTLQLEERTDHLEDILHIAIASYEEATGNTWMLPKDSAPLLQGPSQSTVDAKTYLRQQRAKELAATAPDGPLFAVMGPRNPKNVDAVIEALEDLRKVHPDMVLVHGADSKSNIDNAAVKWVREQGLSQIPMDQPDQIRHKSAAPFKRNDDMIALPLKAVIVFEIDGKRDHGISQNLAQKASEKTDKIPVRRIRI